MPKRADFAIKYQKEIDKLKTKLAIYNSDGQVAKFASLILKEAIERAEQAKQEGNQGMMVQIYREMQELHT